MIGVNRDSDTDKDDDGFSQYENFLVNDIVVYLNQSILGNRLINGLFINSLYQTKEKNYDVVDRQWLITDNMGNPKNSKSFSYVQLKK